MYKLTMYDDGEYHDHNLWENLRDLQKEALSWLEADPVWNTITIEKASWAPVNFEFVPPQKGTLEIED